MGLWRTHCPLMSLGLVQEVAWVLTHESASFASGALAVRLAVMGRGGTWSSQQACLLNISGVLGSV